MNELIKPDSFNVENLDKANYTLSLAAESLRSGLCTEEEYSSLEIRIFDKLADHINLYTGGESTSVENCTAVKLLGSILYNADLSLTRLEPRFAAKRLFSVPFDDLYYEGLRINREYTLKALSLLREVKRTRISGMCVYYNILLNKTLERMIRENDVKFDAKRNFTEVDYPLPTVNSSVCGISGIIHLLEELLTENLFVNSFDKAQLSALWTRYMRELASPVGAMTNLGQLVFEQALLSLMAGNQEPVIPLSEADAAKLAQLSLAGDGVYYAALEVVHKFDGCAQEGYILCLLSKTRTHFRVIFESGEAAIRRYAGIYGRNV